MTVTEAGEPTMFGVGRRKDSADYSAERRKIKRLYRPLNSNILGLEVALVALAGGCFHPEEDQLHQAGVALHPVSLWVVDD